MARKKNQDVNKKKCYNIECVSICISICTDNVFRRLQLICSMLFLSSLYFYLVPLLIFISTIAKLTKSCLMVFIIFFCSFFATCIQKKANLSQHEETKHEKKNQHICFLAPFFRSKWKKGIASKVVQKIDRILSIVQVGICRARIFPQQNALTLCLTMYKMFPCVDYEWYFLLSVRLQPFFCIHVHIYIRK